MGCCPAVLFTKKSDDSDRFATCVLPLFLRSRRSSWLTRHNGSVSLAAPELIQQICPFLSRSAIADSPGSRCELFVLIHVAAQHTKSIDDVVESNVILCNTHKIGLVNGRTGRAIRNTHQQNCHGTAVFPVRRCRSFHHHQASRMRQESRNPCKHSHHGRPMSTF
jgi:hypothetical protein